MQNPTFRAYLENKVLTASPEQLQLMLYEGAIRYANLARKELAARDLEKAQLAFERVDAILGELICGLRPESDPDLCGKYAELYTFCCRRLNEANFRHDPALVDDALLILNQLRETWVLLLKKLAEEQVESAPAYDEQPAFGESLAVSGTV